MKNPFKSFINLFNFKGKTNYMSIAELKAFNLHKEKTKKEKRYRAYISEINQRYNKLLKRENNFFRKAY